MVKELQEFINQTIVNITNIDNRELLFEFDNGDKYKMYHEQDCCEDVYIEDIIGDLNDLLNNPIIMAEEVSEDGDNDWGTFTWTFYRFATIKGYVTLRWYGESNGYYSEDVCVVKMN